MTTPHLFDLALDPFALEAGATPERLVLRGWVWGPATDDAALAELGAISTLGATASTAATSEAPAVVSPKSVRLDAEVPTALLVHALTGDCRAGGPGGWWEPVIGPGRALDPRYMRLICFNNLGSCYGSTGPLDPAFPTREADAAWPARDASGRGVRPLDESTVPATVTTWDQARAILAGLDALGVDRVALATGGSLGGMIVLCLAALAPDRVDTIAPFAASESASPWLIGFNHIQREQLLFDPAWPNAERGLELARQLAHMTYRAEAGLIERHGRLVAWPPGSGGGWSSRQPYAVETYLEHQGGKLLRRFDARAYFVQLGAMDHHDLARRPSWWPDDAPFGRDRIRANVVSVGINTDALYLPAHARRIAEPASHGVGERWYREISSPHGHDAFLIEWDDVDGALLHALAMAGVESPPPTVP